MLKDGGWLKSRPSGLRKIEYATTATGKKLHDRIIKLATAREEALLTGFSKQERENLIRYLHRLLDNLDAVRAVGRDED
jgi:DNA-binding MarR family transcriptional regulator